MKVFANCKAPMQCENNLIQTIFFLSVLFWRKTKCIYTSRKVLISSNEKALPLRRTFRSEKVLQEFLSSEIPDDVVA